jgi:hypothetical protein
MIVFANSFVKFHQAIGGQQGAAIEDMGQML